MKLEYGDLISPDSIPIDRLGHIKSPTARKVFSKETGYKKYLAYINFLIMDFKTLTDNVPIFQNLDMLHEEQKTIYNLILQNFELKEMFLDIFNFFIEEDVEYSDEYNCFLVYSFEDENKKKEIIGFINNTNFNFVCDCLMQINYIQSDSKKELKFKTKRAKELWEKCQAAKKENKLNKNESDYITLPNIISKLSIYHNSYNMLNIWDLTVYQIYDQFFSQNMKNQMDLGSMIYSNHGGEFNINEWFKPLESINN